MPPKNKKQSPSGPADVSPETSVDTSNQDDFAFSGGIDGFFSIASSKIVSITPNQPYNGWLTLGFTDENDVMGINDQMFYVPEPHFYKTVKRWLASKGIEWEDS